MEKGKYYLTICDDYIGYMRKTLIYVLSVSNDTFKFKVADWKADKQERMEVYIHYPVIEQGNLKDLECFRKVKETHIVDLVNAT